MRTSRRPRPRHGLTLIETLVALVLLSGVAVATSTLLRSISSIHSGITPELRWTMHAERALLCAADDASVGDRPTPERHITSSDGHLMVRTRGLGSGTSVARLEVRFTWDSDTGKLVRHAQALDERQRPTGPILSRTLVGSVDRFLVEPIHEDEDRQQGTTPPLAYVLELRSGDNTVQRVIRP